LERLGPNLFLLLINVMSEYTTNSADSFFADYMVVYMTVPSPYDCQNLQQELQNLEKWDKDWLMEFYPNNNNIINKHL
jgi:hypothetical protein